MALEIEWGYLGSLAGAASVGGTVVLAAMQTWFSKRFASIDEVHALRTELAALKRDIQGMPRQADIVDVQHRLGVVEVGLGEMRGDIHGVRDGIGRVEHLLGLMVQAHLRDAQNGE